MPYRPPDETPHHNPLPDLCRASNVSLEIAQSPSRCFNHPMKHTVLSTFLIVAILGLGCMGVTVPSKADELKHPIELGKKCKVLFEEYLGKVTGGVGHMQHSFYYNAFAYAYGPSGSYACGYSESPRSAVENCNTMSTYTLERIFRRNGSESFPSGKTGNDLGGCKTYAKSPVNGKLAIVWKEEPKQVVKTEAKMPMHSSRLMN